VAEGLTLEDWIGKMVTVNLLRDRSQPPTRNSFISRAFCRASILRGSSCSSIQWPCPGSVAPPALAPKTRLPAMCSTRGAGSS
jgi:hypothetical protein